MQDEVNKVLHTFTSVPVSEGGRREGPSKQGQSCVSHMFHTRLSVT